MADEPPAEAIENPPSPDQKSLRSSKESSSARLSNNGASKSISATSKVSSVKSQLEKSIPEKKEPTNPSDAAETSSRTSSIKKEEVSRSKMSLSKSSPLNNKKTSITSHADSKKLEAEESKDSSKLLHKSKSTIKSKSAEQKRCQRRFREMISKTELRKEELNKQKGDLRQRLDLLECSVPAVMVWNIWRMAQGAPVTSLQRVIQKQFRGSACGEANCPTTPSRHYDCRVREVEAERKQAQRKAAEARVVLTEKTNVLEEKRKKLEEAKRIQEERKERVKQLMKEVSEVREAINSMEAQDSADPSCQAGECGDIQCKQRLLLKSPSVYSIASTDVVCLEKLQELAEAELCMKKQIADLERREETYMRTLQQADELWSSQRTVANQELEDELERMKVKMAACKAELSKYLNKEQVEAAIGGDDDLATVIDKSVAVKVKVDHRTSGREDDVAEVDEAGIQIEQETMESSTDPDAPISFDKTVSVKPEHSDLGTGIKPEDIDDEMLDEAKMYLAQLGSLSKLDYPDDYGLCDPDYACQKDLEIPGLTEEKVIAVTNLDLPMEESFHGETRKDVGLTSSRKEGQDASLKPDFETEGQESATDPGENLLEAKSEVQESEIQETIAKSQVEDDEKMEIVAKLESTALVDEAVPILEIKGETVAATREIDTNEAVPSRDQLVSWLDIVESLRSTIVREVTSIGSSEEYTRIKVESDSEKLVKEEETKVVKGEEIVASSNVPILPTKTIETTETLRVVTDQKEISDTTLAARTDVPVDRVSSLQLSESHPTADPDEMRETKAETESAARETSGEILLTDKQEPPTDAGKIQEMEATMVEERKEAKVEDGVGKMEIHGRPEVLKVEEETMEIDGQKEELKESDVGEIEVKRELKEEKEMEEILGKEEVDEEKEKGRVSVKMELEEERETVEEEIEGTELEKEEDLQLQELRVKEEIKEKEMEEELEEESLMSAEKVVELGKEEVGEGKVEGIIEKEELDARKIEKPTKKELPRLIDLDLAPEPYLAVADIETDQRSCSPCTCRIPQVLQEASKKMPFVRTEIITTGTVEIVTQTSEDVATQTIPIQQIIKRLDGPQLITITKFIDQKPEIDDRYSRTTHEKPQFKNQSTVTTTTSSQQTDFDVSNNKPIEFLPKFLFKPIKQSRDLKMIPEEELRSINYMEKSKESHKPECVCCLCGRSETTVKLERKKAVAGRNSVAKSPRIDRETQCERLCTDCRTKRLRTVVEMDRKGLQEEKKKVTDLKILPGSYRVESTFKGRDQRRKDQCCMAKIPKPKDSLEGCLCFEIVKTKDGTVQKLNCRCGDSD